VTHNQLCVNDDDDATNYEYDVVISTCRPGLDKPVTFTFDLLTSESVHAVYVY